MIFFPFHLFAQEKEIIENESGFYYTVQEGDTLWDLSQRFSDSPWLWPDLWQENKQISNPHWIYPGERIRLFQRKDVTTFAPKVVDKKPEAAVAPETPKERPYYYYSPIDRVGFMKKTPISPLGTIFQVKESKELISVGDLVYVKPMNNVTLKPGSKYTVYKTFGPIEDESTKTLIGTQHYLTGVVEVTKIEPRFVVATVVKSYRTISVDDFLMPYKKRSPKVYLTESKPGLKGRIIIAEAHGTISGDNHIMFIDKGTRDGVKRGQLYQIISQEKETIDKKVKNVLLTPVVYGSVLVLYSEPTASTVLVTQSDRSISPGATFVSPN
jgi:hypothetical protein